MNQYDSPLELSLEKSHSYPELEPIREPIIGNMVIEASAGTGKTFTITTLLLRLLLGLNSDQKAPLKLEEILIVTFTNAATAELKERIFKRIIDLKRAILGQGESDPVLDALIEEIKNLSKSEEGGEGVEGTDADITSRLEEAVNLLVMAERSIDQASIFTIHGFSQRLLKENALNMGRDFQFEIAENAEEIIREALYYFWRQECYPLSRSQANIILEYFHAPESPYLNSHSLRRMIQPFLQDPDLIERERFAEVSGLEELLTHQHNLIEELKKDWLTYFPYTAFEDLVKTTGLNGRSYRQDWMKKWHEEMTEWATSTLFSPPKSIEKFHYHYLESRLKEGGDLSRAPEELRELFQAFEEIDTLPIVAIHYAAWKVIQHARVLKQEAQLLGFDDILQELKIRLDGASEELIKAIQSRYRAVMIDEFQDTDRKQLSIFYKLFFDAPEIPFIMIGDPKQSIYRFRGADINAYLSAKQAAEKVRTLSTNYRSASRVIESVNQLFTVAGKGAETFLHKDIPFIEISSPAKAKEIELFYDLPEKDLFSQEDLGGLTFLNFKAGEEELTVPKKGEPYVNRENFKNAVAERAALEVKKLLIYGRLREGDLIRPVESGDITFLVRGHSDAELILSVLKKAGLNAVYLSEKRSVFDPEVSIVSDLHLFLRSLIYRQDRALLMRSLSTILYGLSIEEYQALQEDAAGLEELLEERNYLRLIWRKHGILAMIRTFIVQQDRLAKLRALEDGERLVSDLFHLGELLQAQKISTKEGLLAWLEEQMESGREDVATLRLESDFKTIQVMTYHKSKGLEFPIVFIPFALRNPVAETEGIYEFSVENPTTGREESYRKYLFKEEADETAKSYFIREQLAEEIRFLYVALTRAKYHNFVGFTLDYKASDYPKSALGHLLPVHEKPELLEDLCESGVVRNLTFTSIDLAKEMQHENMELLKQEEAEKSTLKAAIFTGDTETIWRFTSFSHLSYNANTPYFIPEKQDEKEFEDEELPHLSDEERVGSLFPKGAMTGNFIHALLENYAPDELQNRELLSLELERNFSAFVPEADFPALLDELTEWLNNILEADLALEDRHIPPLREILSGERHINELEFIFPVRERLTPDALSALVQENLPRESNETLSFDQLKGMLRGFIDLTFEHNGQFFVVDYKSNYLGPTPASYRLSEMERSIKHAHYDLQYLIYTVALVKFLEIQLPNFDYARDFGGVYYLYLRGMQAGQKSGVYYTKPDETLINRLRSLFDEGVEESPLFAKRLGGEL